MMFCQDHWNRMREAVHERGLDDLVAPDGEAAALQLVDQVNKREVTPVNFDPLMHMHWAIASNAMHRLGPMAMNLMHADFQPQCPICYLNTFRTEAGVCKCDDPQCGGKSPGSIPDFSWMIERSADDAVDIAKKEGLLADA